MSRATSAHSCLAARRFRELLAAQPVAAVTSTQVGSEYAREYLLVRGVMSWYWRICPQTPSARYRRSSLSRRTLISGIAQPGWKNAACSIARSVTKSYSRCSSGVRPAALTAQPETRMATPTAARAGHVRAIMASLTPGSSARLTSGRPPGRCVRLPAISVPSDALIQETESTPLRKPLGTLDR